MVMKFDDDNRLGAPKLPGPVLFPLLLPTSWEKYVETPQKICACTATALDQNVDDTRLCLDFLVGIYDQLERVKTSRSAL